MQVNAAQREIAIKIVYYGPPLSGKTTNLQAMHHLLSDESRGRLMTLDTADDRTLFFDVLPVFFKTPNGFKFKLKLYTVPGQVMHASTRRLVLEGADGVAFIADSQHAQSKNNNDSWQSLKENLAANKFDDSLPVVIQFNKRDLPAVRSDADIDEIRRRSKNPVYTAIAVRGDGVIETLSGLLGMVWDTLEQKHRVEALVKIDKNEFLSRMFHGTSKPRDGLLALP